MTDERFEKVEIRLRIPKWHRDILEEYCKIYGTNPSAAICGYITEVLGRFLVKSLTRADILSKNINNIYNKHDYQEAHNHFGFVISCIYFLKANNKASKVFFRPHVFDNIKYDNFTYSPSTPVFYEAQPGKLLIFRSYIDHFVEQHLDEEQRISLAYNFR